MIPVSRLKSACILDAQVGHGRACKSPGPLAAIRPVPASSSAAGQPSSPGDRAIWWSMS